MTEIDLLIVVCWIMAFIAEYLRYDYIKMRKEVKESARAWRS